MKSGFLSSEFWLHLLAGIGAAVYGFLAKNPDPNVAIATQAAAAVYTVARTYTKTKQVDVPSAVQAAQQVAAAVEQVASAAAPSPATPSKQ